MIVTVCSYCQTVTKVVEDGRNKVEYSHGICRRCYPKAMAEARGAADEMNAQEVEP